MSTVVGWTVVIGCVYIFSFGLPGKKTARDAVRGASPRQRLEGGNNIRKDVKDKAKRQRVEAIKTAQPKAPAPKPSAPSQLVDYSSDDGVDNREFARQLASIKEGTTLNAPKKSDEKRQKSVKQSRAQVIDQVPHEKKVISVPSSNTGADDADDDESSAASPEVKAVDASGVGDMLEPKASGPSVLRLTDTDKAKPKKEKKAKVPEKVETKKQRQNRLKAEAAKAEREEIEKQRKVDMEAQRRQARIAEGRAAKDGSTFVAAQAKPSVWTGNGANASASPSSNATSGDSVSVQPLDTFDAGSHTDVSVSKNTPAPKSAAPAKNKATESWMTSLPSEEEQMEILRGEDAWNTVTKKTSKKKKGATAESPIDSEPTVIQFPSAAKPQATSNGTGTGTGPITTKQAKPISQQSSFAALSPNDEPEVEEMEWDV